MFDNIFTHYFPYMPFSHAVHRRTRSFWHLGYVLNLMALYIRSHFNFSEAGCVANERILRRKGYLFSKTLIKGHLILLSLFLPQSHNMMMGKLLR